ESARESAAARARAPCPGATSPRRFSSATSGGNDLDARCLRQLHAERRARDLLDPRRHRPRRLVELQLAKLGLAGPCYRPGALELDEQPARLVARGDERCPASHEKREQNEVEAEHFSRYDSDAPRSKSAGIGCAVRSATRKVALRERGFVTISRSDGRI